MFETSHRRRWGGLCVPLSRLFLLLVVLSSVIGAMEIGENVPVSMNKVWPLDSPVETYPYYSAFAVCTPPTLEHHSMTFGQILRGDRLVSSLYQMEFRQNRDSTLVCSRTMSVADLQKFRKAIDLNYYFEVYVADLPVNKPIGVKVATDDGKFRYLLASSWEFSLGYNDGQVVNVNMTTDQGLTDITEWSEGFTVDFKYSATWVKSDTPTHARLQQQLASALLVSSPQSGLLDIHWLAITNSFVLVLFVVSLLLLIILRVVRTDLSKYLNIPDEELAVDIEEEAGWKLLHADVFRPPPHRMWFCACVGSGAHLFLVTVVVGLVGCISPYLERGAILSAALFGYLLTSFIAGYISANLYRRLGGVKWAWNILVTALMFMGPVFAIWALLNTVAIAYRSTAALPFGTALFLFACWSFITMPLTIMGGVLGRKRASVVMEKGSPFPCKTNKLAREIPMVRWYQSPWLQMAASGFLPFSAIYIELHYIFASIWGTKVYTLYGVLLMAFCMLLLVAATVSVLLAYFHLSGEDHRWWWRSFVSGGSIAIFFYLHSAYYFSSSTRMFGLLQVAFFFGYSLVVAWALTLVVGFVTFTATYIFVNYIYSSIKSD